VVLVLLEKNEIMKLSLIIAVSCGGLIGKGNGLPWSPIHADMKRFRDLTLGKVVVMGRETWESLPDKYRPLPNRKNIVLTREVEYVAGGATVLNSIEELEAFYNGDGAFPSKAHNSDEIFLIGGASLVEQLYDSCNKAYLTNVHGDFTGDVYLPAEINSGLFIFSDNWDIRSQAYFPGAACPGVDFLDLVRKV